MNIYPEIKMIALHNEAIKRLIVKLNDKIDCDGLYFEGAKLIDGCSVKKDGLYQNGELLSKGEPVDNDYFCNQYQGYAEDSFYGKLWFKTNVPGQFVEISFEI